MLFRIGRGRCESDMHIWELSALLAVFDTRCFSLGVPEMMLGKGRAREIWRRALSPSPGDFDGSAHRVWPGPIEAPSAKLLPSRGSVRRTWDAESPRHRPSWCSEALTCPPLLTGQQQKKQSFVRADCPTRVLRVRRTQSGRTPTLRSLHQGAHACRPCLAATLPRCPFSTCRQRLPNAYKEHTRRGRTGKTPRQYCLCRSSSPHMV